MFKNLLLLVISVLFSFPLLGQKLSAGPFHVVVSEHAMNVWLMVKGKGEVKMTLIHRASGERVELVKHTTDTSFRRQHTLTFNFGALQGVGEYDWAFSTVEDSLKSIKPFIIQDNSKVEDFQFLLGSCAVRIPKLFNFTHPGIEEKIFDAMVEMPSDFMLWTGDNLYYKSVQTTDSYHDMNGQYVKHRKMEPLNNFMKTQSHYAIWDDHDYGPNDSDGSFIYKGNSLKVFQSYWPNPYSGSEEADGVFFDFQYKDIQFFMTDDRYNRVAPDEEDATYLGEGQMKWLKEKLKTSEAVFKFIVSGNQVLSPVNKGESYQEYQEELNDLLAFIKENGVTGVVFLSGDRHHTELMKVEDKLDYPLYEFTNSALTSIGIRPKNSTEMVNPVRVEGTMVFDNNFGRIQLSGAEGSRVCNLQTFSNLGELIWEYKIEEQELK